MSSHRPAPTRIPTIYYIVSCFFRWAPPTTLTRVCKTIHCDDAFLAAEISRSDHQVLAPRQMIVSQNPYGRRVHIVKYSLCRAVRPTVCPSKRRHASLHHVFRSVRRRSVWSRAAIPGRAAGTRRDSHSHSPLLVSHPGCRSSHYPLAAARLQYVT